MARSKVTSSSRPTRASTRAGTRAAAPASASVSAPASTPTPTPTASLSSPTAATATATAQVTPPQAIAAQDSNSQDVAQLAFGESLWDMLPAELHEMILSFSGILTRFVWGRVGRSSRLSMQTKEQLWREAFAIDWSGDLSKLPNVALTRRMAEAVRSRSMFHRLCARFPALHAATNPSLERTDTALNAYKPSMMSHLYRYRLEEIPLRHGWLDLVDLRFPIAVAMAAIRLGCVHVIKHLVDRKLIVLKRFVSIVWLQPVPYKEYYIFSQNSVLDVIAGTGSIEMFAMFVDAGVAGCTSKAMDLAASHGHLDMVKYLHEHRTEGCTKAAMDGAAANGHLDVLIWLHEHRTEGCTPVAMESVRAGRLPVAQWLMANRTEQWPNHVLDLAATSGNLELVKWLHGHGNGRYSCTAWTMDNAALGGNVDLLAWAKANTTEECTCQAYENAAINGHVEAMQWLYDNSSKQCYPRAFASAAQNGQLESVRWLYEHHPEKLPDNLVSDAASYNHLDIIQWLIAHTDLRPTADVMKAAVRSGHLDIVKYLHEYGCEADTSAMDDAACVGHLDVIVWLHNNRTEGCTTKAIDEAAKAGAIDVVEWLLANRSEGFTFQAVGGMTPTDVAKILVRSLSPAARRDMLAEATRRKSKMAIKRLADPHFV